MCLCFFLSGHVFDNHGPLMGSLCQLLCSLGALTHCGSLSDQINVAFPCNAATSETHHRHSYTQRNPDCLWTNTWVLSLIVGCPQSANDPGIKARKQRTQRPVETFSLWVKCQSKNYGNCFVCLPCWSLGCSLESPLTDTLHSVKAGMRLELLIRPTGETCIWWHIGAATKTNLSKFIPVS